MSVQTIECPYDEDHAVFQKVLAMLENDSILVHCKKHKWIRLKFYRDGEAINFDGVQVRAFPVRTKWFKTEQKEVIAFGKCPT